MVLKMCIVAMQELFQSGALLKDLHGKAGAIDVDRFTHPPLSS